MAETTGIAWTDSTFNPWIGCTKVSPGCDHCYAEALDARYQYGTKKENRLINAAPHWGPGAKRWRTSETNWRKPLEWNQTAMLNGKRHLVFCASMADVFDNEVPDKWREDLWKLIEHTPYLTWLLLTKRIGNAARMLRGWSWPNVWLGASVVDQAEADRDIPKLLATPAAKRFVSYEPALGPVDFTRFFPGDLHWIIVGGESAQTTPGTRKAKARHFDVHWARETIRQCKAAGVACFVKQLGSNASTDHRTRPEGEAFYWTKLLRERAGADPAEWPVDLRVQEFPS